MSAIFFYVNSYNNYFFNCFGKISEDLIFKIYIIITKNLKRFGVFILNKYFFSKCIWTLWHIFSL